MNRSTTTGLASEFDSSFFLCHTRSPSPSETILSFPFSLDMKWECMCVASVGGGSDPSASECNAGIFKVCVLHPSESFVYLSQATSLNQQQRRALESVWTRKSRPGEREEAVMWAIVLLCCAACSIGGVWEYFFLEWTNIENNPSSSKSSNRPRI